MSFNDKTDLAAQVFRALDIAIKENGCEELLEATPYSVAVDLATYDADLGGENIDLIVDAVKEYQSRNKK